MKKVLVFFNSQQAVLKSVVKGVNVLRCEYAGGEEKHLKILFAGIHLVSSSNVEIYIASDRELTSPEIVEAANSLL
ncbi:hypothetical protein RN333_09360 [Enterobacter kobei]|jgi:hypothetical protein|uniref:hypothetical protein n=1 Tax=Enterobacter kobei TaxID=208224 RepID=UPI0010128E4C|nr:hypothetical protein [Enterobacter kobei]WNP36375.1 hypothetical protein RN333_09360 [Enterobacter kobei]